jgi:hypothetical protein
LSAAAKKLDVRKTFKSDKENVPANPTTPLTSRKHASTAVTAKPLVESPKKYQKAEVTSGHVVRVARNFTRPQAAAFISKYIYAYTLRKRWRNLSSKWRASKDSAPDRKRNKTIEELIATERKYVGYLRFAIEVKYDRYVKVDCFRNILIQSKNHQEALAMKKLLQFFLMYLSFWDLMVCSCKHSKKDVVNGLLMVLLVTFSSRMYILH